jgi:hypothetical protein
MVFRTASAVRTWGAWALPFVTVLKAILRPSVIAAAINIPTGAV